MKLTFVDIVGEESQDQPIQWDYHNDTNAKPSLYYIGADRVNQRIQIRYGKMGRNFDLYSDRIVNTKIEEMFTTMHGVSLYGVNYPEDIPLHVGANAKNLNPFLHVGEGMPGRDDVDMVVLTVGRGVSYIRSLPHDEVQLITTFRESFHDASEYKGCCIVYCRELRQNASNTENGYIPLMKFDGIRDGILIHYEVALFSDGTVSVVSSEIMHNSLKSKLMSIYETATKRRGFIAKIWNSGVLSPNMDLICGDIPVLESGSITQDELDDPKNTRRNNLVNELKNDHCRALMLKNLKLPKGIIAELRLLYIFTVDETGKIRTVKSN